MAVPPGQQPFSNYEKSFLLCEILKTASPSPNVLLGLVNHLGIEPNWLETALPPGRTVNQCAGVFRELRRAGVAQPMSTPGPLGAPQTPSPMSAPLTLKRPSTFEGPASFPTGREIRPKPSSISIPYGQPSPIEHPPKKKRGRPTKAEAQAKQDAHTERSEQRPAPRPQQPGVAIAAPPQPPPYRPAPAPDEEHAPEDVKRVVSGPIRSRMPISSMLTPTGQKPTSQSSSSSGKRRRGRSIRSEPEDIPLTSPSGGAAGQSRQSQEYESPYARVPAERYNSPAGAAVPRHLEEEPQSASPVATTQSSARQPPQPSTAAHSSEPTTVFDAISRESL